MSQAKKVLSFFLSFIMILNIIPYMSFAADDEWKKGSVKIFSSATNSTHHPRVITKEREVYINIKDLVKIYNGEIVIMKKEDENWIYKQNDKAPDFEDVFNTAWDELVDFIYSKRQEKGSLLDNYRLDKDEYVYILKSDTALRALRYNCASDQWFILDSAARANNRTIEIPEMASPILYDNEIYVDLLPVSKLLGAVIKLNVMDGGLCYYIPETNPNEFVKTIKTIISSGGDLSVELLIEQNGGNKVVTFVKVVGDIVLDSVINGELGSVVRGDYLEDKYDEAITAAISLERETSSEYEQIWQVMASLTEKISSKDGIKLMDDFSPGFDIVSDVIDSEYIKDYFPDISNSASAVHSGEWLVFKTYMDIYLHNKRVMDITVEGMNSAYNVFVKGKKYVPYSVIGSGSEKTCTDLVKRLYNEYYKGETRTSEFFWENVFDLGIDLIVNKTPIIVQLGLNVLLYDYEYGNTAYLSAYYNIQSLVREACYKSIESNMVTEEKLQYIYDCALMYTRLKLASMKLMKQPFSYYPEVVNACRLIDSLSPQQAFMGSYEYIEENCGVKKEDLYDLVKYELSTDVSFSDIYFGAILLELESHGEVQAAALNDCDVDGKYEMFVEFIDNSAGGYHSNCIIVDGDSATTQIYAATGVAGDADFVYEADSGRVLLKDGYYTAGYSSTTYFCWNGTAWEEYANGSFSQDVFQDGRIGKESVNAETWNTFSSGINNIYLSNNALEKLQTMTVKGDPQTLLDQYETEAKRHSNFFAKAAGILQYGKSNYDVYIFKDLHKVYLSNIASSNAANDSSLSNIRDNVYYAVLAKKINDGVEFQIASILYESGADTIKNISANKSSVIIETDSRNMQFDFSVEEQTGRPIFYPKNVDTAEESSENLQPNEMQQIVSSYHWITVRSNPLFGGMERIYIKLNTQNAEIIWGDLSPSGIENQQKSTARIVWQSDGTIMIYFDFKTMKLSDTPEEFSLLSPEQTGNWYSIRSKNYTFDAGNGPNE